jgi:hypothetical protein
MKQLRSARSSKAARWGLCALGLVTGQAALAQEQGSSPYYLGATQAFTRDSNILRRNGVNEKKDTISSTGLRAGIDQSFGRQHALVGLDVKRNRYSRYSEYNNTEYGANGRLDWSTIGNVSGTLSANADRSLYRSTTTTSTARNLQTNRGAALQVVVGTVTRWSLDGALSTNRSTYSATSNLDIRQNAGGLGLKYRPSDALSLRTGVRRTKGAYISSNNDFTRDDLDFDSMVDLSGVSRLNTRLSFTRMNYDNALARDFRGWTGSLGWNWRPTGKLQFNLLATRDNSVGSVNQYVQLTNNYAGDTRLTNSFALQSAYELSSKIALNGSLSYARRTLDNSFLTVGSTGFQPGSGKDRTKIANISVRYTPLRNVELGCGFAWEDRDVSAEAGASSTISFPYTARSYTCSGQVFLR